MSSSSPRSRYEITTADAAQQPAKVAAWVSKRPECGGAAWAGPGDDGSGFHAPPKPRRFGTGVFHSSDLKTGALLGRGKFAQVKLVEAVKADEATWFAVKEIRKRNIVDKDLVKKVQNEIELLAELHHPFVCHIFGGYQDDAKVSLVVEYVLLLLLPPAAAAAAAITAATPAAAAPLPLSDCCVPPLFCAARSPPPPSPQVPARRRALQSAAAATEAPGRGGEVLRRGNIARARVPARGRVHSVP